MTESELLQGLLISGQSVGNLFAMFLTMVSAYIAGLYFFLRRATFALRLLAFAILSIGLAFLGGAAALQQSIQLALFAAWAKLPSPSIPVEMLFNPIQVALPDGFSFLKTATAVGWITAASVYLALGFMTFFYRWKALDDTGRPVG